MSSIQSSDVARERSRWLTSCADPFFAGFDYETDNFGSPESIEFAEEFEREFARLMDQRGIAWQYKPRTFAIEWDEDGNFIDSFTPSFFVPERGLYLELVAPSCFSLIEQLRKTHLLRQQYPGTSIEVFSSEGSIPAFMR